MTGLPPASTGPGPEPDGCADPLRLEIQAPDFTESILDRVALHRTFLDRRARRLVWVTRCAIGASALVLAGAVVFVQARYPAVRGEEPRPTPISDIVVAAQSEAARLEALRGRLDVPVASAELPSVRLTLGTPSPLPSQKQAEVRPLTAAAAPGAFASAVPSASGAAAAEAEAASAPGSQAPAPFASAAPAAPVELAPRRGLPSATEAVLRFAITADAPSAPRLLRASTPSELPPILQGPISNEIRLPR